MGCGDDGVNTLFIESERQLSIELRFLSAGVTTIAGGKWSRGGGHIDGASEEAKFSSDFDVVYVGSSCSLLVIDRGNKAIREIQLHFDDCAYQYGSGYLGKTMTPDIVPRISTKYKLRLNAFNVAGIVMLMGAGFFGYMLALLQRRLGTIVASGDVSAYNILLLSLVHYTNWNRYRFT